MFQRSERIQSKTLQSSDAIHLTRDEYSDYRIRNYGGMICYCEIRCPKCKMFLFNYQVDGNCPILEFYKDKILDKSFLVYNAIICYNCLHRITYPLSYIEIYDNGHYEKRLAYKLL